MTAPDFRAIAEQLAQLEKAKRFDEERSTLGIVCHIEAELRAMYERGRDDAKAEPSFRLLAEHLAQTADVAHIEAELDAVYERGYNDAT